MRLCIFGAGGFAKEVLWLARRCEYDVAAFIDRQSGKSYGGIRIEGEDYFDPQQHVAVIGVGNPMLRRKIVNELLARFGQVHFPTLIAPSANLMGNDIILGQGSVVCANCVLTCNIELGEFARLNLATTIGHDVRTGGFFTTAPGVHISGKVKTGDRVYLGTNSSVIESISIASDVVVGAGASVCKNLETSDIYVGVPAKRLLHRP
jgi:sugar O-acyltransferase (sialic acid O-acetyltransferase NeuD family)